MAGNTDLVSELIDVSKAINTDWFAANISYEEHPNKINDSRKITLGIVVTSSTIVNLMFTPAGGAEKTWALNRGDALVGGALYYVDFILTPGDSWNIQHDTLTQNVTCRVFDTTRMSIP